MKLGGILDTERWDAIDLSGGAAEAGRVCAAIREVNTDLAQARNDGRDHVEYIAMLGTIAKREPLTRADAVKVAELLAGAGWFVGVSARPVPLFMGGTAFKLYVCRRRPSWFRWLRWEIRLERCQIIEPSC